MVGNDALLRCSVPGFAADLISVVGWTVFGHDGTDLVDVKHGEGGGRNLGKKGAETPRNRGLGPRRATTKFRVRTPNYQGN